MQSLSIQPENLAQTQFKYVQNTVKSTSTLSAAGGNSVTIPLGNMVLTPDTLLYFPVQNEATIPAATSAANIKVIRKFLIGDKRFLSNTQSIFNKITLTSNEIKMNSEYSQYVNNLVYYRNNKKDMALNNFYASAQDSTDQQNDTFLDPLVIHNTANKHFANLVGTRAADNLYFRDAGTAVGEIAADAFFTFVPIPLKMLLPGLFEFQDSFFVSNASLTLNFNVNPYIIGYQVINKQGALANNYLANSIIPFNLKFITGQQVTVYQTINTSVQPSPAMYDIKEFSYDLNSISQTITFENVQMFAFMIIKTNLAANNPTTQYGQDLIYVDNGTVEINQIRIGGNPIYTSLDPKTLSVFQQQKAFGSISGFHLPTQILSFCSFDAINSSQTIQIDLKTAGTGYKVVLYSISERGMDTQMMVE